MKIEPRALPPTGGRAPEHPQQVAQALPAARQVARFETLLGHKHANARKTLREVAEQASDVQALDPVLFSGPRSLQLLDHILDDLLPQLNLEPDIRALAEDLLREEIHMRHLLQQQRSEAAV